MLDLSDSGGVTQLSGGRWPNLQRFTLYTDSDLRSTAGIISSLSGNWQLLQEFCLFDVVLDKAALSALTAIRWSQLQTLHIDPFDDAMPEVMRGYWPELRELSIGLDLRDDASTHLCKFPWSTLERLQLTVCDISQYSTDSLVHANLPNLQELFLVCLSRESGLTGEGMFSCFARLAQGKWPLLSRLELRGVAVTQECLKYLELADGYICKHWRLKMRSFLTSTSPVL